MYIDSPPLSLTHAHTFIYTYIHTHVRTYIQYIQYTHTHTHMHAYTHMQAHMHAHIRTVVIITPPPCTHTPRQTVVSPLISLKNHLPSITLAVLHNSCGEAECTKDGQFSGD